MKTPPERLWHLEGARGLACLQVVALHAAGCFVPGLIDGAGTPWQVAVRSSPLRFLYDGDVAVFLFFVLSGCVLASPFRRWAANPVGLMVGRIVRFAVPVLLAVGLGLAVSRLLPGVARQAGLLLGAGWLNGGLPDATLGGALRGALVDALILGYRDLSPLSPWLGGMLAESAASLDPPLWTLSIEMQGSLLILALTQIERHWPRLAGPATLAAAVLTLRSPLLCFIAGYVCATSGAARLPRIPLALAAIAAYWALAPLAAWCEAAALPLLPGLAPDLTLRGWVAILIFPLLLHGKAWRGLLASAPLRWLGAMSFPLYLVHWPVMFGPGAAMLLAGFPVFGQAAGLVAAGASVLLSFLAAIPFARIDRAALALGRWARDAWPAKKSFNTGAQSASA